MSDNNDIAHKQKLSRTRDTGVKKDGKKMKLKKAAALGILLLVCMQYAFALPAYAAEVISVDAVTTTNSDGTITVVQTYPGNENAPALPEIIVQDNREYALKDIVIAVDPTFTKPTQRFTGTVFSQIPVDGIHSLGAYFPAAYAISAGEYQGEIGLDPYAPYAVLEQYEMFIVQVDKVLSITDLPDNDVTRIPVYCNFVVVSTSVIGGTMVATLKILNVNYEITGCDHLGLPNNYTAHVTYRGQEGLHELVYYDVTAYYTGDIASMIDQMVITATYSPIAVTAPTEPTEPEGVEIALEEVPLAQSGLPLFSLAITGATVAVFLALPLLYILFLSNARLIRISGSCKEDKGDLTAEADRSDRVKRASVRKVEKSELICRRRLVMRDGIAEFRIPPDIEIFDGATYCLIIKPHFASRAGCVQMVWRGKVMAAIPLARYIDINFQEMLITSTEAAMVELELLD